MKKLLIFPKYNAMGPSSRYRIYNYLQLYEKAGVDFEVYPLLEDWYLKNLWSKKSKAAIYYKIIKAYLKRLFRILAVKKNSIVYIGAELFPYLPFGIERYLKLRNIPYIVEFDDAIFHHYDRTSNFLVKKLLGRKTEKVIKNASAVIGGCQYLCDYARQWNSNVIEIPTSIDKRKYLINREDSHPPVIGWIGSPATARYLDLIVNPLLKLSKEFSFSVHLIGCDASITQKFKSIPHKIIQWTDATEVQELSKFSIGIMPLEDTPFARGKCAFKLVQYMAMGIPTVSTPLQSNINISKGNNNLFASNEEEWYESIKEILSNSVYYNEVGIKNREIAYKHYTIQNNWIKYIELFQSL